MQALKDMPVMSAAARMIPVVAAIYEDWFRVETYYRQDTRALYTQLLPKIIEELAADTCAANGVRLERQFNPPRRFLI